MDSFSKNGQCNILLDIWRVVDCFGENAQMGQPLYLSLSGHKLGQKSHK